MTVIKEYTSNDNLVLQSLFTVLFLSELQNIDFTKSNYFLEKIKFPTDSMKEHFKKIGVCNIGCALMSLYGMLVIPKDLEFISSFDKEKINQKITLWTIIIDTSTYPKDSKNVDFLTHLRNALSHSKRLSFKDDYFIFSDEDKTKHSIQFKIKKDYIGNILKELEECIYNYYINRVQEKA